MCEIEPVYASSWSDDSGQGSIIVQDYNLKDDDGLGVTIIEDDKCASIYLTIDDIRELSKVFKAKLDSLLV